MCPHKNTVTELLSMSQATHEFKKINEGSKNANKNSLNTINRKDHVLKRKFYKINFKNFLALLQKMECR